MTMPPVACVICEELTVMAGLVFEVLLVSVTLVAVMVKLPLVPKVKLKDLVPATRAAFVGDEIPVESLDNILTVSVTVLIRFQLASTALTLMVKGVVAV